MKNIQIIQAIAFLFISLTGTSCSAIGGIFKAGMGVGIFIAVAVVVVIVFLIMRSNKK